LIWIVLKRMFLMMLDLKS